MHKTHHKHPEPRGRLSWKEAILERGYHPGGRLSWSRWVTTHSYSLHGGRKTCTIHRLPCKTRVVSASHTPRRLRRKDLASRRAQPRRGPFPELSAEAPSKARNRRERTWPRPQGRRGPARAVRHVRPGLPTVPLCTHSEAPLAEAQEPEELVQSAESPSSSSCEAKSAGSASGLPREAPKVGDATKVGDAIVRAARPPQGPSHPAATDRSGRHVVAAGEGAEPRDRAAPLPLVETRVAGATRKPPAEHGRAGLGEELTLRERVSVAARGPLRRHRSFSPQRSPLGAAQRITPRENPCPVSCSHWGGFSMQNRGARLGPFTSRGNILP